MPLNPCRISFPDRDLDEGDLGGTITWEAPKTLSKVLTITDEQQNGVADLDSELVYEIENPINQTFSVCFLNLQTLVHFFPSTFWSLQKVERVGRKCHRKRYKLRWRVFPPYRTPDAGGELSDLFGRECSGCWDTQEAFEVSEKL